MNSCMLESSVCRHASLAIGSRFCQTRCKANSLCSRAPGDLHSSSFITYFTSRMCGSHDDTLTSGQGKILDTMWLPAFCCGMTPPSCVRAAAVVHKPALAPQGMIGSSAFRIARKSLKQRLLAASSPIHCMRVMLVLCFPQHVEPKAA